MFQKSEVGRARNKIVWVLVTNVILEKDSENFVGIAAVFSDDRADTVQHAGTHDVPVTRTLLNGLPSGHGPISIRDTADVMLFAQIANQFARIVKRAASGRHMTVCKRSTRRWLRALGQDEL